MHREHIITEFIYDHCFVPRTVPLTFKPSDCDLIVVDYNHDTYITVNYLSNQKVASVWFRQKDYDGEIPMSVDSASRHRLDGPAMFSNVTGGVRCDFYINDVMQLTYEGFLSYLIDNQIEISENVLFNIGLFER